MLFFSESKRGGIKWQCDMCSSYVCQQMSGYSNLCQHINHHHQSIINKRAAISRKHSLSFSSSFVCTPKNMSIHSWMKCIVFTMQPFFVVENNVTRKHFKHQQKTVDTMMRYLRKLTTHVEKNISTLLSDKFEVKFGGWSGDDTHYFSVFESFSSDHPSGYSSLLLSLTPMGDEERMGPENMYE